MISGRASNPDREFIVAVTDGKLNLEPNAKAS